MREDEHRRRFRNIEKQTGSCLIRKDVLPDDSCNIFTYNYSFKRKQWYKMLEQYNTSGLFRPDPFGINDYYLDYSLNKKKRWTIPDEIGEEIENLQDPPLNLRVSASVHVEDRSSCRWGFFGPPVEYLPCMEYHTVSRDGKKTHRQSTKVETRIRNFTHPISRPSQKGKNRATRYRERYDMEGRDLAYDDKLQYQPVHINYTTILLSDRPSLHNKAARSGRGRSPRPVSKKYVTKTVEIEEMDTDMEELEEYTTVTASESFAPTIVADLSSLVVNRSGLVKRTRKRKHLRRRFVDETLKTKIIKNDDFIEEEEGFAVVEKQSSSNRLSLLNGEFYGTIELNSVSHLQLMRQLPCYPHAWKIPQSDTKKVFGCHIDFQVIAKQNGDILELFEDKCPLRLPELEEDIPLSPCHDYICPICYEDMNEENTAVLRTPFSLSCSHLFCTECWLSHIFESINRKRLPAACLEPDCTFTMSVSAATGLLDSSSLLLYESALIEVLSTQGKLLSCTQCERLHYHNGNRSFHCPCGLTICTHCSQSEHFPVDCDVYRQYSSYMHRSGYALSLSSPLSSSPIVSDLVQCPTCKELMQRNAGCNHLQCPCGCNFCFSCGKLWNAQHHSCDVGLTTKVALTDAFQPSSCSLLAPSLLTLAVQSRVVLLERRKELRARLSVLSTSRRIRVERIFIKLTLMLELCYLNSRRSRVSKVLATRINLALDAFFNTNDCQLARKTRTLEDYYNNIH